MPRPEPFRIAVPDAVLQDLSARLRRTRWPDELPGAGWAYGTDTAWLRPLMTHWADGFDWRAQEARLNAYEGGRVEVDGAAIHFLHARSKDANAVPLLLLHGWPSSLVQMLDLLPLLTAPAASGQASFHVIAASLPGFGFSGPTTSPGMSLAKMAPKFLTLMGEVLGYERFAGRGSDLGAGVLQQIAVTRPEALIGLHLSGTNPYLGQVPSDLSPDEQAFVKAAKAWNASEMAYAQVHSSKPQTVAHALNDSPAGLAAWILEKFARWSDSPNDPVARYGRDALLANLTVYWATGTINSSMRAYYESARDGGAWGRSEVPSAYLMATHDMFPTPRAWIERSSRVDRWTVSERGGHFLEWEEPALVARDLRTFFATEPLRSRI